MASLTPCFGVPFDPKDCEKYLAASEEDKRAADQILHNQRVSAARILNLIVHDPKEDISEATIKLLNESPELVGVLTQAQIYVDLPALDEKDRILQDLARICSRMSIATGFGTVLWGLSIPGFNLSTLRLANDWAHFQTKDFAEGFQQMQRWNENHRDWMLENHRLFQSGEPPKRFELARSPRRIGIITCASNEEEIQKIKAALLSWIKYAIDFGYETTTIQISDDSPAAMAPKVQNVLTDLRKQYPSFGFKYFGQAEKQAYRTKLVQALLASPRFAQIQEELGGELTEKLIDDMVQTMFLNPGPTENRNFSSLMLLGQPSLQMDQDHFPLAIVKSATNPTENTFIPVDPFAYAELRGANLDYFWGFEYCGFYDSAVRSILASIIPGSLSDLDQMKPLEKLVSVRSNARSSTRASLFLPASDQRGPRFTLPVRNGDVLLGMVEDTFNQNLGLHQREIPVNSPWHSVPILHADPAGRNSRTSILKLMFEEAFSVWCEKTLNLLMLYGKKDYMFDSKRNGSLHINNREEVALDLWQFAKEAGPEDAAKITNQQVLSFQDLMGKFDEAKKEANPVVVKQIDDLAEQLTKDFTRTKEIEAPQTLARLKSVFSAYALALFFADQIYEFSREFTSIKSDH